MRRLATKEQLAERSRKEVSAVSGRDVFIDGFNIVIMLEVLLSDSILFSCMDETVRDLSALRGTYRIIPETQGAVRLLLEALREMEVREKIVFIMRKR